MLYLAVKTSAALHSKQILMLKQPLHVQEVQRKFEKYGDVTLSRIVRNPVNGESRGFGFVDMKDDEGADEVRNCILLKSDFKNWTDFWFSYP